MECIPRVNPNVNYGLWVILMCQCRFIVGNKHNILESDINNGEATHVWGKGVYRFKMSILSPQICYKTKSALKNNILKQSFKGLLNNMDILTLYCFMKINTFTI